MVDDLSGIRDKTSKKEIIDLLDRRDRKGYTLIIGYLINNHFQFYMNEVRGQDLDQIYKRVIEYLRCVS